MANEHIEQEFVVNIGALADLPMLDNQFNLATDDFTKLGDDFDLHAITETGAFTVSGTCTNSPNSTESKKWGVISFVNGDNSSLLVIDMETGDLYESHGVEGGTWSLWVSKANERALVTISEGDELDLLANTDYINDDVELGALTITTAETSRFETTVFFKSGETPTSLTLPADIKWANGTAITVNSDKTYQISIRNGVWTFIEA